jgi:hypothetical protein
VSSTTERESQHTRTSERVRMSNHHDVAPLHQVGFDLTLPQGNGPAVLGLGLGLQLRKCKSHNAHNTLPSLLRPLPSHLFYSPPTLLPLLLSFPYSLLPLLLSFPSYSPSLTLSFPPTISSLFILNLSGTSTTHALTREPSLSPVYRVLQGLSGRNKRGVKIRVFPLVFVPVEVGFIHSWGAF